MCIKFARTALLLSLLVTTVFAQDSLRLRVGRMGIIWPSIRASTLTLEAGITPSISIVTSIRSRSLDYNFFTKNNLTIWDNYSGLFMLGAKLFLHPDNFWHKSAAPATLRGLYIFPYYVYRSKYTTRGYSGSSNRYYHNTYATGAMVGYQTWLSPAKRFTRSLFFNVSVGGDYIFYNNYNLIEINNGELIPSAANEPSFQPRIMTGVGVVLGRNPEQGKQQSAISKKQDELRTAQDKKRDTVDIALLHDSIQVSPGKMMILGADIRIPTIVGEFPIANDFSLVVRGRLIGMDAIWRTSRPIGLTQVGLQWYFHPHKTRFPRTTAGIARGMYLQPFVSHENAYVITENYLGSQNAPYVEYTYKRNGIGVMLGYQTWLSKLLPATRFFFMNASLGLVHYPYISYKVLFSGPGFTPYETQTKVAVKAQLGAGFVIGKNPESQARRKHQTP